MAGSPIGCHALVWTGEFDADGIVSSVERTRAAGFDLVEFPLMDPDTFDAAAARSALADAGMTATASLGLPEHADISSADPDVVAAGAKLLQTALDQTAEMGAIRMCGVLYGSMRKHMAPMSDRGRANSVEAITDLAEQAQRLGHRIGSRSGQPVRVEHSQHRSGCVEVPRGGGSREVSVHLDTYHMNIEESDMFQPFLDTQRAPRLRAHRREPPRLSRYRVGRFREYLPGSRPDRFRRSHRLRVVLLGRGVADPEQHPGHLAQSLERLGSPCRTCQPIHPRPPRRGPHHRIALTASGRTLTPIALPMRTPESDLDRGLTITAAGTPADRRSAHGNEPRSGAGRRWPSCWRRRWR